MGGVGSGTKWCLICLGKGIQGWTKWDGMKLGVEEEMVMKPKLIEVKRH